MENEIWKNIDIAPNYAISNLGRVKKNDTEELMRIGKTSRGYNIVSLRIGFGREKTFSVARLVATAFIPNPNCGKVVKHLGNKDNDAVGYISWSQPKKPTQKPHTASGLDKKIRKVKWLKKRVESFKLAIASIEQEAITLGQTYNFWQESEDIKKELRRIDNLLQVIKSCRNI